MCVCVGLMKYHVGARDVARLLCRWSKIFLVDWIIGVCVCVCVLRPFGDGRDAAVKLDRAEAIVLRQSW